MDVKYLMLLVVFASSCFSATITINFDDLAPVNEITDQYSQYANFSNPQGAGIVTRTYPIAGYSPPYYICASVYCTNEVLITFTYPASYLNFTVLGINNSGRIAICRIFQNDLYTDVPVNVSGVSYWNVSLAYTSITKLLITNVTDYYGLGYDNFVFEQQMPQSSSSTPSVTPSASRSKSPTPSPLPSVAGYSPSSSISTLPSSSTSPTNSPQTSSLPSSNPSLLPSSSSSLLPSSTPSPTSSPLTETSSPSEGVPVAAIVPAVLGGILFVGAGVTAAVCIKRRKQNKEDNLVDMS